MKNISGQKRVDMDMVYHSIICSIYSAISLSIITIIATISINFHFIAFIIFGLYYFIFYVLLAIPIQIKLNQNPKKYNITYLLIYLFGALVASALAIIILGETPFTSIGHYFIAIFSSFVYWFFDSLLPQKIKQ